MKITHGRCKELSKACPDDFNEGDMAEELIEYALLAMTLQECIDIARKQVRHDILALSSDNIRHMYNSLIGATT